MSSISSAFTNYIVPAAMHRHVVIGAGCLLVIPALEMVKCAMEDLSGVLQNRIAPQEETESEKRARLEQKSELKTTMIVRAVGAVIFGACALNSFPASGAAGLLGFLVYSRFTWKKELKNQNPCISTLATGFGLYFISQNKGPIAKTSVKIGTKIGSALQKVSAKIARVVQKILSAGKAFGKGIVKVISLPFKFGVKFLKLFKPFIRHPLLGLGLLGSIVCVILCVKYGHQMTGAAALLAKAVNSAVKALFAAGSLTAQGLGQVARPLGTALTFIPSVLAKTVQVIRNVVYFIFHPLQAIGFYKPSSA